MLGEGLTETLGQMVRGIGIVVADGGPPIVVPCDMLQGLDEGPEPWDVTVSACRRKEWGKGFTCVWLEDRRPSASSQRLTASRSRLA